MSSWSNSYSRSSSSSRSSSRLIFGSSSISSSNSSKPYIATIRKVNLFWKTQIIEELIINYDDDEEIEDRPSINKMYTYLRPGLEKGYKIDLLTSVFLSPELGGPKPAILFVDIDEDEIIEEYKNKLYQFRFLPFEESFTQYKVSSMMRVIDLNENLINKIQGYPFEDHSVEQFSELDRRNFKLNDPDKILEYPVDAALSLVESSDYFKCLVIHAIVKNVKKDVYNRTQVKLYDAISSTLKKYVYIDIEAKLDESRIPNKPEKCNHWFDLDYSHFQNIPEFQGYEIQEINFEKQLLVSNYISMIERNKKTYYKILEVIPKTRQSSYLEDVVFN